MSAAIVYEGQMEGQGGTLFKDLKFWVAQRVPMRQTWLQNIENNGGTITKLEKKADYLIADHARKDSPAGSYSWKWIEDSVKSGQLMDQAQYAIKPPGNETRPVGTVNQKTTRRAFTKADDELLSRFVTRKEKQGVAVSGNVIYKQFEAKYPHHTFQSWRDRWVKKLQFLDRPNVSENEPSLSPPPETAPVASSAPARPTRGPGPPNANSTDPSRRKRRVRFTPDEDKLLLQYVDEMKNAGHAVKGKTIYEGLAVDFPQHTAQSWRDRYLRYLAPPDEQESVEEEPTEEEAAPPSPPVTRSRRNAQKVDQADRPPPKQDSRVSSTQRKTRNHTTDVVESDARKEDMPLRIRPSIEEPSNVTQTPNDNSPTLEASNQHGQDEASASDSEQQAVPPDSPMQTQQEILETSLKTRTGFHECLAAFKEESSEVNYWPTIQGRAIDLWDLWQSVQAQKVEFVERDWERVAEDLEFDWVALPTVTDEIRQCYESHLLEFEKMVENFFATSENGEDDTQQEVTDSQEVAQPMLLPVNTQSDSHFNSSPPKQPSRKRAREAETAIASGLAYPESPRKRTKLRRDSEIPSTPDDKNGTVHLRQAARGKASPQLGAQPVLPRSSHSLMSKLYWKQIEREVQEQIKESIALSSARKAMVEPETQDFQFGTQEMDDFGEEFSEEDGQERETQRVTPSEQLRSELDAENRRRTLNRVSPLPDDAAESSFLDNYEPDFFGEMDTPEPSFAHRPNPVLSRVAMQPPNKRRSLPASFTRDNRPSPYGRMSMPGPARMSSGAPTPFRQWISSTPQPQQAQRPEWTTYTPQPQPPRRSEWMSTPQPQAQSARRAQSKAEELADVVEYWVALGYSPDIARRSLEATTWESSLAGRIMQFLKDGNAMPTNWEGVWTPRDDENLILIDSPGQPRDDREIRKRAKAADRLVTKHGEQRMELRRKWLYTRSTL
ncbi:hypothetical protein PFICI_10176 [Pestalotiopsis fici W106-1]|uniref:DNA-binding protein RAP1 n=1 Tax=Pestalotiopsis fici (strain W106-1 / CGMCC3.15140) TaxID=1229662 RepID=W3WWD2_PESFW|nr:uncharacterized protein PFICI_10176 [Pestalotiopsis fici W106-1]ETS78114.1 hypothetical protein PFICI_10176 [Pestalotiopsis fici W106-1]